MSIEEKIRDKKLLPSERWQALKEFLIQEIDAIDLDTTWEPCEPLWWLEMMEVRRKAQNGIK